MFYPRSAWLGQGCAALRGRCGGGNADNAVAVEVPMEGGLERFEGCRVAGHGGIDVGEIVAVAVGAPDGVEAGGRIFPGDVVAARHLNRANGSPGAVLADGHGCAPALELGSGLKASVHWHRKSRAQSAASTAHGLSICAFQSLMASRPERGGKKDPGEGRSRGDAAAAAWSSLQPRIS
jgi:hypothetical protein